jgi:hypothetical protein
MTRGDTMLDSEKMAIAAHLHVVMRRKIGRVTDIEWLMRNAEYAREVIRLALADPVHTELIDWGQRLQEALFPAPKNVDLSAPASVFSDSRLEREKPGKPSPPRYVNTLR